MKGVPVARCRLVYRTLWQNTRNEMNGKDTLKSSMSTSPGIQTARSPWGLYSEKSLWLNFFLKNRFWKCAVSRGRAGGHDWDVNLTFFSRMSIFDPSLTLFLENVYLKTSGPYTRGVKACANVVLTFQTKLFFIHWTTESLIQIHQNHTSSNLWSCPK